MTAPKFPDIVIPPATDANDTMFAVVAREALLLAAWCLRSIPRERFGFSADAVEDFRTIWERTTANQKLVIRALRLDPQEIARIVAEAAAEKVS
jgi:hypothetical protein